MVLSADDHHPRAATSSPIEGAGDSASVRSAIEGIDRLQTEVARVIRLTRADTSASPAQIAELTAQVAELRASVVRWHRSLDLAQGPTAATGRRTSPASLDDTALRRALRGTPEGLAPRQIREALRIDHTTSSTALSRLLSDAVARGAVRRTGKGPGTRYHAAPGRRPR